MVHCGCLRTEGSVIIQHIPLDVFGDLVEDGGGQALRQFFQTLLGGIFGIVGQPLGLLRSGRQDLHIAHLLILRHDP
jgi:hypothetical protein